MPIAIPLLIATALGFVFVFFGATQGGKQNKGTGERKINPAAGHKRTQAFRQLLAKIKAPKQK